MKAEEYVKNVCSKCKHQYTGLDVCEIRKTVNGEWKCINYEKCSMKTRIIRYIKRLFRSQRGTGILR